MTKITLTIALNFLVALLFSQQFTTWKTVDDFFNNTNAINYYGDDVSISGNNKVKIKDSKTNKKISFKIYDSLYFAYKFLVKKSVFYKPVKDYATFCGETKDLYMVIFPLMDNFYYDSDGYAKGGNVTTFDQFAQYDWFIVTDPESKEKSKELEKTLANTPELLKKYRDEKAQTDKKTWENKGLAIHLKYIKEYNKLKKTAK